jgi:hypothetical protein
MKGLLNEPTSDAQPWPRERVLMAPQRLFLPGSRLSLVRGKLSFVPSRRQGLLGTHRDRLCQKSVRKMLTRPRARIES